MTKNMVRLSRLYARKAKSAWIWFIENTGIYTRGLFVWLVALTFLLSAVYHLFEEILQPLGPGETAHSSYFRTLMDIFILLLSGFDVDKKPVTVVGWACAFMVLITNIVFIGAIIQGIGEIIVKAKGRRMSGMATTSFLKHTVIFGLTSRSRAIVDLYLARRSKYRTQMVLVDNRLDSLPAVYAAEPDWVDFVKGTPFSEDVLLRAGLKEASNAIVCPPDDVPAAEADSYAILVALAVERFNPNVSTTLILRDRASRHFLDANTGNGRINVKIDQVICPDEIVECLTANAALNPGLSSFVLDVLSFDEDEEEGGEGRAGDNIIVIQDLPDSLFPDADWRSRPVQFRALVDRYMEREQGLLLGFQGDEGQEVLPVGEVRVGDRKGLVLRKERRG